MTTQPDTVTFDFHGKVALVTGAASGIGKATAVMFAANGAKTIVADRDAELGQQVVDEIRANGGDATFVAVDVQDEDQIKAMIDTTVTTYGGLDIAYNNAGISGRPGPMHLVDFADYRRIIEVNQHSVFLSMKYEILYMLEHGGGRIVNCASFGGLFGVGGMAAYTASKHAVVGLTRAGALEHASTGIRINAVCPGGVQTALTAGLMSDADQISASSQEGQAAQPGQNRMAGPEEIASMVLFLSSDAASFITGAAVSVDGGLSAG